MLRNPRIVLMMALTAFLISVNWGVYVWAIAVDRTSETALGYYIKTVVDSLKQLKDLAGLTNGAEKGQENTERDQHLNCVNVATCTKLPTSKL